MINHVLLILTGKAEEGEYNLTMEDASAYSPRFFSAVLTDAHQHVQARKGKVRYDLVVPPIADDYEGRGLVDQNGFFPVEMLQEIIAKVHEGTIRFRHVDFESPPRRKR